MIIQTLKLPAPESGSTMLRALAIGYAKLDRKTVLILPNLADVHWFQNHRGHPANDFDLMTAREALNAWKRGGLATVYDCILVDEISHANTAEGNLWDILIHSKSRSGTVLIGSETTHN
ncbi:hypothetical protein [Vibrio furnissii]|uniref:hypothetical protein n=1 Tax=Vibrio furnissii TaxID=29494 RepID=UPI001EEB24A9|nr:hypothetical protein [Vibrio furnissii]MCG6268294.1 hypothetical protein [Vibrio furnissii]